MRLTALNVEIFARKRFRSVSRASPKMRKHLYQKIRAERGVRENWYARKEEIYFFSQNLHKIKII